MVETSESDAGVYHRTRTKDIYGADFSYKGAGGILSAVKCHTNTNITTAGKAGPG